MKLCLIENTSNNCNYYIDFGKYLNDSCDLTTIIATEGSLQNLTKHVNPDAIILGFSITTSINMKNKNFVNDSNAPVYVILNKEYSKLTDKLNWIKNLNPTKAFTVCHDSHKFTKIVNIPFRRIMWSADERIFKQYTDTYTYDAFFSGVIRKEQDDDIRNRIYKLIKSSKKLGIYNIHFNVKLFNGKEFTNKCWKDYDNVEYAKTLESSKICFTSTGPYDLVGTRYFEIMATNKSLILCNKKPKEIYEYYIIDGFNCVMYENEYDAVEKMKYYLIHEKERLKIVKNAYEYFINNLTWTHEIKKLLTIVNE